MVATGATVADAVAEWLRYAEHDRACKPTTMHDYRLTARRIERDLGHLRLEDVTTEMLERWKTTLPGSNRTIAKRLVILHGIFRRAMRVWRLPATDVERPRYALRPSPRPRRRGPPDEEREEHLQKLHRLTPQERLRGMLEQIADESP